MPVHALEGAGMLEGEALQCASIAFGIGIGMFSELIGGTSQDATLEELLLLTDELRHTIRRSPLGETADDPSGN